MTLPLWPKSVAVRHLTHETDGEPLKRIKVNCGNYFSMTKRCQDRAKGVLPVTIFGTDGAGEPFQEIAHTLDITANGARIRGIRHRMRTEDIVTLQYRHRRVEFRVVGSSP